MSYQDILYEERDQIAYISINRPDVMNAFRGQTVEEMLHAMLKAGWDKNIAAIVIGGTGDRAFCTGGDVKEYEEKYTRRPRDYWKYMGLFRAWTVWRPAASTLVYPAPESPAQPLPPIRERCRRVPLQKPAHRAQALPGQRRCPSPKLLSRQAVSRDNSAHENYSTQRRQRTLPAAPPPVDF